MILNMTQTILIVLLMLMGLISLAVIMVLLLYNEQNKRKFKRFMHNTYSVAYKICSRIAPIPVENLRYSYQVRYVMDITASKVKTAKTIVTLIGVTIISLIVSLELIGDIALSLIMASMVYMYTASKLKGDGIKFLEALCDTIEDMIHLYNANNRNIDQMFTELLNDRNNYVYCYMEDMYNKIKKAIIDDTNSEIIIAEYNRDVPSRHLRLMFNYLYMTYRYGDETTADGEHLFNKNMLAIQREVNADLTRNKEIKNGTIGEQWFIMGSILLIPSATWYMKEFFTFENFESISRFLDSSLGYTIKLACSVYALLAYYIYMKILDSNSALEPKKSIYWEEVVLKNKLINRIVSFMLPKRETLQYKILLQKVNMVDKYNGLKPLYLRKIIISVLVAITALMVLSCDTYISYSLVKNDIYRGVNTETMDMILKMENFQDEYKARAISNDDAVIQIVRNDIETYQTKTIEERRAYILQIIKEQNIDYGMYPEVAADRIMEKVNTLERIHPSTILIIALIGLIVGYFVPNITLNMTLILSKSAMIDDEVIGYYTVVMLLVNHSASNIYMLLRWLRNFADIYLYQFQQCLDNLCESEILELKSMVSNKELSRLVESILMAYKGIDLKSAFAGIEQRYAFQESYRRISNTKIIKHRISCSEMLTWSVMGSTFGLYILLPMCYSIYEMLIQVM